MNPAAPDPDALFAQAIEIACAEERARFLEQACADNPELRREVEKLVRDHFRAGAFLERPATHLAATLDAPREKPGTLVGPYKLMEQIGEGGMGVVYVAEQAQPVRRKVALKLIKPGLDSRQVIARFEVERQALALMDHPNIAKVLDAGTTDAGRPYFVMELVKGIPITAFCDEQRLSTRQRLGLFVVVCQAVQHAHHKGVIHRDLKPSNVLVAVHDVNAVVKVIDFGTAKATGQQLTDKTVYTGFAQMVGTPLYMSPEQAGQSALDVDTRSDVYSLGVLLYELLTGTTPFEQATFRKAGYDEMRRMIREDEPPRPSARLSTLEKGQLSTVSERRAIDARRLSQEVRGDLDWVVMKALEKDRNRRYETASALAADVQRYLDDEPVQARPPTAGYRLRKFVRRNRGPVLAGFLVVAALVLGLAGSLWQAVRATQAEGVAVDERDAKEEALGVALVNEQKAQAARIAAEKAAEAERQATAKAEKAAAAEKQANVLAQKRLGQIKKANEVLASIFRDLNPQSEEKGGPTLKEQLVGRLDQAAAQLQAEAIGDAVTVAQLQIELGMTYLWLGEGPKAVALLEKVRQTLQAELGPDHPETLACMNHLAAAYREAGQSTLALPLFEETLKLRKAKLGLDHPDVLDSMNGLAMAYLNAGQPKLVIPMLEEALKRHKARLGADDREILSSMNSLAAAYKAAGMHKLATPLFEETFERNKAKLGPDHPDTLMNMNNLATAYRDAGKLDLAASLLEEALKRSKVKLGPDHPFTLLGMANLAVDYQAAGKLDLALPLLEETLKRQKAKLGRDHPNTLWSINALAVAYWSVKQLDKSIPLFEEALKGQEARLGRDHPETLNTMANLGVNYRDAGRLGEAIPLLEEAFRKGQGHASLAWAGLELLAA
jgi:serine/threonine protein kinase